MSYAPNSGFNDRIAAAREARKAVMTRIEALPRVDAETLRAREAERAARRTAREAEAAAHRQARAEAERVEALRLEAQTREDEAARAEAALTLAADQKAARDARYAARKARAKA